MKYYHACITAAILIVLTVAGALLGARYLDETAYCIVTALDDLPEDPVVASESVKTIQAFWEDRRKVLSFTLSETSLDGISLLFDEVLVAIQNADTLEYEKATARLRRAVENINQLEKIALSNIF